MASCQERVYVFTSRQIAGPRSSLTWGSGDWRLHLTRRARFSAKLYIRYPGSVVLNSLGLQEILFALISNPKFVQISNVLPFACLFFTPTRRVLLLVFGMGSIRASFLLLHDPGSYQWHPTKRSFGLPNGTCCHWLNKATLSCL